jgi:hypothetical protein
MQGARGEEIAHLRRLEGLLNPGAGALELEAVAIDASLPANSLAKGRGVEVMPATISGFAAR